MCSILKSWIENSLGDEKNLQNTEIIPILTYFPPDFQFPRGGNSQGILKTEPPPKFSTRGSARHLSNQIAYLES